MGQDYKLTKKFPKVDDTKSEKQEFHFSKIVMNTKDVHIDRILVFNKFLFKRKRNKDEFQIFYWLQIR